MVGSCFIYKLGMLTGQRFQAELSPSFLWKFTEFRAETPPMPLEFQTALPPHVFGIPVQETPPLPRNSKMPPVVWYGYFLESPILKKFMLVKSGFLSFGICNSMQLKDSRTLLMNRIRNPENQSIYQSIILI